MLHENYEWTKLQVMDNHNTQTKNSTYLIETKIFFSTYGQVQNFYFMNHIINFV